MTDQTVKMPMHQECTWFNTDSCERDFGPGHPCQRVPADGPACRHFKEAHGFECMAIRPRSVELLLEGKL